MSIKLVITDIDGVWTDGGMYYDQTGNEWKKFNTSDSAGILFCRAANKEVAIITGEESQIVRNRAQKLKINNLFMGVSDKVQIADMLIEEMNLEYSNVAYIGDDINDVPLLRKANISGTVADAPYYIKNEVDFITQKKGGEGAFREFVEYILLKEDSFEMILDSIISVK